MVTSTCGAPRVTLITVRHHYYFQSQKPGRRTNTFKLVKSENLIVGHRLHYSGVDALCSAVAEECKITHFRLNPRQNFFLRCVLLIFSVVLIDSPALE